MTTEQQKITDAQIIEWLNDKLSRCITIAPAGAISFNAQCDNFTGNGTRVRFRAYHEAVGHAEEHLDSEGAIESFRIKAGAYNPKEKAEKLRNQAAALLAEAEELESETN